MIILSMKQKAAIILFLLISVVARGGERPDNFEPMESSLRQHKVPSWYDDAKLGIFIHWGLYSVPAWAKAADLKQEIDWDNLDWVKWFANNPYAEWYYNSMRIEGSSTRAHHRQTYGDDFDYYDFSEPFNRALDKWDPNAMASLFRQVHARYVVLTTKHHDGYTLWPSRIPNPNLAEQKQSTQRDVVGELTDAVRKNDMRMGLYYSGGIDWSFHPIIIDDLQGGFETYNKKVVPKGEAYAIYADAHWRELIDRYQPDVLWNDITYPSKKNALKLFSDYYNTIPEGVINDRWSVGVHDYTTPEYAKHSNITDYKWEAVRGIGQSFGYNRLETPKQMLSVNELVDLFVDIVSKNGNLLLNVGPKPDGSISELQLQTLKGFGSWLDVNGVAIFGTRPWERAEGRLVDSDVKVRFTSKDGNLFAILLSKPKSKTITLESVTIKPDSEVYLLGHSFPLSWCQQGDNLSIILPEVLQPSSAYALKVITSKT